MSEARSVPRNRIADRCSPQAEIRRWALNELAAWRGFATDPAGLSSALRAESQRSMSVYLLHIADGHVTLDDKASGYALVPPGEYGASLRYRAAQYRDFIQDVLTSHGIAGSATLALELDDLGVSRFALPVFAFQKRRGANTILLPDVDFLHNRFFEHARPPEPHRFADKRHHAIFVGSTTGNPCLTADDVRTGRNARLRSALFFKDQRDVSFLLPNIVQIDTPETYALIRSMGVGRDEVSWDQQLRSRYLVSIDGNGATCSRVVLAMLSNSVLLKYQSPYLLYYFQGMRPWVDYIPIIADRDVVAVLDDAELHLTLHTDIAAQSRDFALQYLSRVSVELYTAHVLRRYLAWFGDGPAAAL